MKIKLKKGTKVLIVFCFIGLSLLLYPRFSNYWNLRHSTQVVNSYENVLEDFAPADYHNIWDDAIQYNKDLLEESSTFELSAEMKARYDQTLNVTGDGLIGYIEIPKIGVTLPLYHTCSSYVLQSNAGHLEWSSLPTGGESTHCVISAHRGLPSAKLFTDLDMVREGDIFKITVLDQTLNYEVDRIRTVEPEDLSELTVQNGKDICTLFTCTPYGINTHRLLVRGHRIANDEAEVRLVSEAVLIDELVVAAFVGYPILFILTLIVLFKKPESKKR